MTKEQLDMQAEILTARINGINGWIKANPNTDPNYYEVMDCYVDYATLVSSANAYYSANEYPEVNGKETTHYDIISFDPAIHACHLAMNEMLQLRGVFSEAENHFGKEPQAHEFLVQFQYRAVTGEYQVPENPTLAQLKKEVLCKSMSVPFYIWQEQRKDSNFKYDNVAEFTALKEQYGIYQTAVGVQEHIVHLDKSTYEGPQFGEQVEALLDRVEKSYKYSEVYNTETVK